MKKKKKRSQRYVYEFSVDYNIIDKSNMIGIHIYLMKKKSYKIMFGIAKKKKRSLLYY